MLPLQSKSNDQPVQPPGVEGDHAWTLHQMGCWVAIGLLLGVPMFAPPPYAMIVMSLGSAALLTWLQWTHPDSFRGRSGSLWLAYCLLSALWLTALMITAASLQGWVR